MRVNISVKCLNWSTEFSAEVLTGSAGDLGGGYTVFTFAEQDDCCSDQLQISQVAGYPRGDFL